MKIKISASCQSIFNSELKWKRSRAELKILQLGSDSSLVAKVLLSWYILCLFGNNFLCDRLGSSHFLYILYVGIEITILYTGRKYYLYLQSLEILYNYFLVNVILFIYLQLWNCILETKNWSPLFTTFLFLPLLWRYGENLFNIWLTKKPGPLPNINLFTPKSFMFMVSIFNFILS